MQNSAATLLADHRNVLIIRTFSKIYGLAGLRVGYLLGDEQVVKTIKEKYVISEAGVSSAGLSAAIASIDDYSFIEQSYSLNISTKKYITKYLDAWDIKYSESKANFLYFPIDSLERQGKSFSAHMAAQKIMCPPFAHESTRFSRMTIGTRARWRPLLEHLSN